MSACHVTACNAPLLVGGCAQGDVSWFSCNPVLHLHAVSAGPDILVTCTHLVIYDNSAL